MSLGIKLEHILSERNLTVAELSRMSGVNTNTLYSCIRRNTRKIDPDVIRKLATALNIDIDYFTESDHVYTDSEFQEIKDTFRSRPMIRKIYDYCKTVSDEQLEQTLAVMQALTAKKED